MILYEEIGKVSRWRYGQMSMFAAMGTLEMQAQNARELFDGSWETCPVQREGEYDVFEALFMNSDTPLHMIVNRNGRPKKSYIKSVGLGDDEAEQRVSEFLDSSGFETVEPDDSFIRYIQVPGLEVDKIIYDAAMDFSKQSGKSLGAVLGFGFYGDILKNQIWVSGISEEVVKAAKRRFGI